MLKAPAYGFRMSEYEKDALLKAFGAKTEVEGTRKLNLKPIMQLKSHLAMTNAYKNIKYSLDDLHEGDEVDTAGYFGTDHR